MKEAATLLSFNFDPVRFEKFGINLISNNTRERVEKELKKIERIVEKAGQPSIRISTEVHQIYRIFMNLAPIGLGAIEEEFSTVRKVRKLAYSLSYTEGNLPAIICSEYISFALHIINTFWRFSMFFGIFEAMLKNWHHLHNANGDSIRVFILEKIKSYSGKRKILNDIKNDVQFYSRANGGIQLGAGLAIRDEEISKVCNHLNLPFHSISYSYFSDVAAAYAQTMLRKSALEKGTCDIAEFLKLHQNNATSKICYSLIIPRVDATANVHIQDQVMQDALYLIGDPASDAYWEPWESAGLEERTSLKKAQITLNEWLTRRFITLFFDKIAMDSDRKAFWLKYVRWISRFKIYGSQLTQYSLNQDERIRSILKARFGILQDGGGNQSALVMVVKDYVLVEFSLKGAAFFAYRSSNPLSPDLSHSSIRTKQLKLYTELLMRRMNNQITSHRAEGKFAHHLGWERFLQWWLERYVGV